MPGGRQACTSTARTRDLPVSRAPRVSPTGPTATVSQHRAAENHCRSLGPATQRDHFVTTKRSHPETSSESDPVNLCVRIDWQNAEQRRAHNRAWEGGGVWCSTAVTYLWSGEIRPEALCLSVIVPGLRGLPLFIRWLSPFAKVYLTRGLLHTIPSDLQLFSAHFVSSDLCPLSFLSKILSPVRDRNFLF